MNHIESNMAQRQRNEDHPTVINNLGRKQKMMMTMANEVMATMLVTTMQETPEAVGVMMTMVVKQKTNP